MHLLDAGLARCPASPDRTATLRGIVRVATANSRSSRLLVGLGGDAQNWPHWHRNDSVAQRPAISVVPRHGTAVRVDVVLRAGGPPDGGVARSGEARPSSSRSVSNRRPSTPSRRACSCPANQSPANRSSVIVPKCGSPAPAPRAGARRGGRPPGSSCGCRGRNTLNQHFHRAPLLVRAADGAPASHRAWLRARGDNRRCLGAPGGQLVSGSRHHTGRPPSLGRTGVQHTADPPFSSPGGTSWAWDLLKNTAEQRADEVGGSGRAGRLHHQHRAVAGHRATVSSTSPCRAHVPG